MDDRKHEWSRIYCCPELDNLELIHAHYVTHSFSRHSHDFFVIGLIEQGVQSYTCRGIKHITPAGDLFLVQSEEAHTGEAFTDQGYVYRTIYPSATLLTGINGEDCKKETPFFRQHVIHDPSLSRKFLRFHQAVCERDSALACESLFLTMSGDLIRGYSTSSLHKRDIGLERPAVQLAREYVDAHYGEDVSLTDLARLTSLNPTHIARVFEREVGLPPHAYLEQTRIAQAKLMLTQDIPLVEIALAIGYPDQSHFTHRFKRFVGVTPGQYRRARKITQDFWQPRDRSLGLRKRLGLQSTATKETHD
jgi:AraC-like DNA-binding protein